MFFSSLTVAASPNISVSPITAGAIAKQPSSVVHAAGAGIQGSDSAGLRQRLLRRTSTPGRKANEKTSSEEDHNQVLALSVLTLRRYIVGMKKSGSYGFDYNWPKAALT